MKSLTSQQQQQQKSLIPPSGIGCMNSRTPSVTLYKESYITLRSVTIRKVLHHKIIKNKVEEIVAKQLL